MDRDRSRRAAAGWATATTATLATLASLLLLGSCSVGDQDCTFDSNPADKNDACPYGPPGGPKPPVSDCPDIPQKSPADCSTDWVNDVFPILATEGPQKASCTSGACHGGDKATAPRVFMPADDAKTSYDELSAYEGAQKYPYVNTTDPKHSWILCNLQDPPGVGQVMPAQPGALTAEEFEIVTEWASCGMVYDKGGGVGGSGTGGAGGGGGGAGGAGGAGGG